MNQSNNTARRLASRSPWLMLLALGVAVVLQGCPASGIYRTARTLEKGESDFGLSFNATRYTTADTKITNPDGTTTTNKGSSIVLPNLIPELNYHVGIAEDMEFGGRIGLTSGLIEFDFKYRFIGGPNEKLHVAVQPAIGYRALFLIEGAHATLPVIATYDLTPSLAVNVAPYVSYLSLSTVADDVDAELDFGGTMVTGGAVLGVAIRGEVFYIMPTIDFSQTMTTISAESSDANGTVKQEEDASISYLVFGVSFGWVSGKELKKLKTMDDKLDRIEKKLDAN